MLLDVLAACLCCPKILPAASPCLPLGQHQEGCTAVHSMLSRLGQGQQTFAPVFTLLDLFLSCSWSRVCC